MTAPIRILGVDASLRCTGLGVVEAQGSRMVAVATGTLRTKPTERHSACLRRIHEGIHELIGNTAPAAAAIEGGFFHRNAKTADILGQVRGVVIAACAERDLPIYEYAPRRVKQAVVGYGDADKSQVGRMVMRILALAEEPQADIGDALAVAICHLHNRSTHAALSPEPL